MWIGSRRRSSKSRGIPKRRSIDGAIGFRFRGPCATSRMTIWTSMSAATKNTIAAAVKHGLLTLGQYRRTLARTTLPGIAVLGYHGLRADDLPSASMAFENLHLRASTFDAHCRVIRECCDPISLDD